MVACECSVDCALAYYSLVHCARTCTRARTCARTRTLTFSLAQKRQQKVNQLKTAVLKTKLPGLTQKLEPE